MILSAALLVAALSVGVLGPAVLARVLHARVAGSVRIAAWLVLVAGFFGTVITAAVIALLPGHGPALRVIGLIDGCLTTLQHGELPHLDELLGTISALLAGGVVAAVIVALARHQRHQNRLHRRHVDALSVICRREAGPIRTWWLPLPEARAYSIAGAPALIVATEGLRQRLPAVQVAAVLDHERAHVRGRHHLLLGVARALAAALPWLPLARRSPAYVAAAVELSADSSAARKHGPATVHSALQTMTRGDARPPASLAMADDFVELRLRHLRDIPTRNTSFSRAGRGALTVFATAALPAVVTLLALAAAAFFVSHNLLHL